jgi:hypothetical protein
MHRLNKTHHPTSEKTYHASKQKRRFIHPPPKTFYPTAEQKSSSIKISIIKRVRSFVNMDTYSQSIKT